MKCLRVVECLLLIVVVAITSVAFYRHKEFISESEEKSELLQEEFESVYKLIASQNRTDYAIMDMQMRIFHYAKPHDKPVQFCPECINLKEALLEAQEPITMISVKRHKELLKCEAYYKQRESKDESKRINSPAS